MRYSSPLSARADATGEYKRTLPASVKIKRKSHGFAIERARGESWRGAADATSAPGPGSAPYFGKRECVIDMRTAFECLVRQ